MTDSIATVEIKIDPQSFLDVRYDQYKKSVEAGKPISEANLGLTTTKAMIEIYIRKLVQDRFPLDNEIKEVKVVKITHEEES